LYPSYSALYPLRPALYSSYSVIYPLKPTVTLPIRPCILSDISCTLLIRPCIPSDMYFSYSALYSLVPTLYFSYSALYPLRPALYSSYSALYPLRPALHSSESIPCPPICPIYSFELDCCHTIDSSELGQYLSGPPLYPLESICFLPYIPFILPGHPCFLQDQDSVPPACPIFILLHLVLSPSLASYFSLVFVYYSLSFSPLLTYFVCRWLFYFLFPSPCFKRISLTATETVSKLSPPPPKCLLIFGGLFKAF